MKYCGLAVDIESGGFWDVETAHYLLGEYTSRDEMFDIADYQKRRIYSDEVPMADEEFINRRKRQARIDNTLINAFRRR